MTDENKIYEAYKETLKEMEKLDEARGIEGNWKGVVSSMNMIFDQLERLQRLGAYNDPKFGKKFKKLDQELYSLADELDSAFGEEEQSGYRG